MTIQLRTFTPSHGITQDPKSAIQNYMTTDETTSAYAREFFLDPSQGGITEDISGGCPIGHVSRPSMSDPVLGNVYAGGASLTGTARQTVPGKDVVIQGGTDGRGLLAIEDSPDGNTWTRQALFHVNSGKTYGIRFTPLAAPWYRVMYFDDNSQGASKVRFWSQSRT